MEKTEILKLKIGKYKITDNIYINTIVVSMFERKKTFRIKTEYDSAISIYPEEKTQCIFSVNALYQIAGISVFGEINFKKFKFI